MSLTVREIQMKATVRHHLAPVRIAIIDKSTVATAGANVENREPFCTVGGNGDWCSHYGKKYGNTSNTKNRIAF